MVYITSSKETPDTITSFDELQVMVDECNVHGPTLTPWQIKYGLWKIETTNEFYRITRQAYVIINDEEKSEKVTCRIGKLPKLTKRILNTLKYGQVHLTQAMFAYVIKTHPGMAQKFTAELQEWRRNHEHSSA